MLLDTEQMQTTHPIAVPDAPRKDVVPAFRVLAGTAFLPAGLLIAFDLIYGKVAVAEAVFGGFVMALLVYGMLALFARHMFGLFVPNAPSGQGNTQALGFALMSFGKFIVLGGVLFVFVRLLHLSLIGLIGGFLITQITISAIILSRLAKTKITN